MMTDAIQQDYRCRLHRSGYCVRGSNTRRLLSACELTKYLYTCIIGELVALAFKSAVGDTTEARKTKTNTIGEDGKGAAG